MKWLMVPLLYYFPCLLCLFAATHHFHSTLCRLFLLFSFFLFLQYPFFFLREIHISKQKTENLNFHLKLKREMLGWVLVAAAALTIGTVVTLLAVFIYRLCNVKERKDNVEENRAEIFRDGVAALHQVDLDNKRRGNYYVLRRGFSSTTKPLFNWADHPSLITDAVENGWSIFGFKTYVSSPSTRSSLLGLRSAAGDSGRGGNEIEVNWEVCQGSADFMQKIRLNSGHHSTAAAAAAASVIRTALPLPGPPLGNSAFPQEAYFEITILYCRGDDDHDDSGGKLKEGEWTKLIRENPNPKANSDINKIEESKIATKMDDGKDDDGVIMLSVGLTAGGSLPMKLPGSYPGSIGFNSDGSVYLDGNSLFINMNIFFIC